MSLNAAIKAAIWRDDWVLLRILLSQQVTGDDGGVFDEITDNDIDWELYLVASHGRFPVAVTERIVEACRLLRARLSQHGQQKYFDEVNNDEESPLHEAVEHDHLFLVRLFIQEFNFNVNQHFSLGYTPLYYAVEKGGGREDMVRFLIQAGADANRGGAYGPLFRAVLHNNAGIALFLLQQGANPNLNRERADDEEEDEYNRIHPIHHARSDWAINGIVGNQYMYYKTHRNTDWAMRNGNAIILSMLLQNGAFVGHDGTTDDTSLNDLLRSRQQSRQSKLTVCRILAEHARLDNDTALFMQLSLDNAIQNPASPTECLEVLLEAGVQTSVGDLFSAIRSLNEPATRILVQHGVDPIVENAELYSNSPFLLAAQHQDTCIFEYFLDLWDERFASSSSSAGGGGKNFVGDYPIHVVCCDPYVSLQAIKVLVNRQADALATVDGEQGLLPFHFAAMWDARLDVIFYLLQHCPDALHHHHHVGNTTALLALEDSNDSSTLETNINDDNHEGRNHHVETDCVGQVKKKAKTMPIS